MQRENLLTKIKLQSAAFDKKKSQRVDQSAIRKKAQEYLDN